MEADASKGAAHFHVLLGFLRLHSAGAALSCDETGRRLDLPGSTGHHDGFGQLDDGLCQC